MWKPLLSLLFGSLLIVSCGRTRIVTDNGGKKGPETSYFCGAEGGLSWKKTATEESGANKSPLLPKAFQSYTVLNAPLFFERAKAGAQEVLIPLPTGCIPFKVSSSGTMSGGLQEKYPQLVSLRGTNGAGDDLRLDWDGSTFKGQVLTTAGGKTYLITPVPGGAADSYMVYDQADTRDQKQPFENSRSAPPAGTQQRVASPQADK